MAAGGPGDHPLTDILFYQMRVYSARADELVLGIAKYVSRENLYEMFDWWEPPAMHEFEKRLAAKLTELKLDADSRGWEPIE